MRTPTPVRAKFVAYISAAKTFADNAAEKLIFDGISENQNGSYNPATGEFVAPEPGHYRFDCHLSIQAALVQSDWTLDLAVNDTTVRRLDYKRNPTATAFFVVGGSTSVYLKRGDKVSIYSTVGGSSTRAAQTGIAHCSLSGHREETA